MIGTRFGARHKDVGDDALNAMDLEIKLPAVNEWIARLIEKYRVLAQPVGSFGFMRLPTYFTNETLDGARVVVVDSVPKPPLAALGLPQFADFEALDSDGITYQNFYFLNRARIGDESLHFHELVHIIQWRALGAERFLREYALGHISGGEYRNNPFEQIAFDLQERFIKQRIPFNVEPLVLQHLDDETVHSYSASDRP